MVKRIVDDDLISTRPYGLTQGDDELELMYEQQKRDGVISAAREFI